MKKSLVFLLCFMLVFSSFTMLAAATPKNNTPQLQEIMSVEIYGSYDSSSTEIITVIVELQEVSIVEAKHTGKSQSKGNLQSKRNNVIASMKNEIKGARVDREYDYLFSGFSVELQANEVLNLARIPGVKAIYPNVTYTTSQVGRGIEIDEEYYSPLMMDSAPFIGADVAWEAGFTGRGITVAVIDTGVDYTHPDLAHAFGDYKGWDFVDNDNDPQETSVGDPDLNTDHGTHVAGTVAANGVIKGVAPDATLLAYRVLGPGGSGTTANVIAGIERAVEDGAAIMNLSLGADVNNPDYATSIALDWAMAEGVVAVTSNGNSGPNNWTVGSPGTSRRAISVGASQLPYNVYTSGISTSEEVSYESPEVMGFPSDEAIIDLDGETFEFVYVGLGQSTDFVGLDLTDKVALIKRGAIPFVEKSDNAKAAGAIATIIFNSADDQIEHYVAGISLPTIKISGTDGKIMLAELEEGNNEVTFSIEYDYRIGETIAGFSSRGPVMNTWMIKPDVSAPGVGIVSTIPTHNPTEPHGYAAFQGTSMASPHVAGAAALILQANPSWGVEEVKAALMNTAVDVFDPATGKAYPHNTQGAGSIRVVEAINTKTLVTPGSHSFGVFTNNDDKQVEGQRFVIQNLSNDKKRYSFEVEFAGNPKGIKVNGGKNIQINAGKSQQVNMNVQVDAAKLSPGYYEGVIKVSDGVETIKVPTILFVGEPDYPRVLLTGAYFGSNGDGTYYVGSRIPFGGDVLEYDLYNYSGTVGAFIDTIGAFEDIEGPIHVFDWDGKVYGNELPNGEYVLAIYVEKDGRFEYKGYVINKN